ncbi:hypothetical protein RhiirC2_719843 [Rhizophagus irregularis]|uniref:DNA-directed DNA polymerase n=1 Tax=Rhizophagus irregularis TaxID=588596 RepID=A0A2N1MCM2_9GLOM|nr:hypothetical protein RhiirC2_719843 [Rhizophagus irregularis]
MQPNPYRIFWDLEMLTEKLTPEEKTKLTHTERLQMHKPCGYCYIVVRMDSSLNYEIISHDLYRGPDALEKFVEKIEEELANIQEDLSAPAEMIMSPGDLKAYNEATECWICKGPFLKPAPEVVQKLEEAKHNLLEIKEWESCMEKEHPKKKEAQKKYREALSGLNRKVKDYDHINGNYRGPAHDSCNKKLRIGSFETKVPLICHNFRGYDSHPLMKVVSKKCRLFDLTFQHMAMGLDKLVVCLGENPEKFPLTVKHFTAKGYSIEKIKLLFRKGVFPYDWTNAWEKFDRTSLPPRKEFYSILSQQNISKEDYKYAQKIWQTFEMQSFGDYHDLYLETDVLLLADVFMNYTIMCLQDDGLDPSHYVSAPGMFNDSLYKSSGVELKLMTDMDEYLMVENGIRGGMTMASHRYAKANNPKCPDYDPSKPTSWTLYEDMNALYSAPEEAEERAMKVRLRVKE